MPSESLSPHVPERCRGGGRGEFRNIRIKELEE